jgi:2'-5' RNA ligase
MKNKESKLNLRKIAGSYLTPKGKLLLSESGESSAPSGDMFYLPEPNLVGILAYVAGNSGRTLSKLISDFEEFANSEEEVDDIIDVWNDALQQGYIVSEEGPELNPTTIEDIVENNKNLYSSKLNLRKYEQKEFGAAAAPATYYSVEYIIQDKKSPPEQLNEPSNEFNGLNIPQTQTAQDFANIFEDRLPADWTEMGMGEFNGGNFYTSYNDAKIAFDTLIKYVPLNSNEIEYKIILGEHTGKEGTLKTLETFTNLSERLPRKDEEFDLPGNLPEGMASRLNLKKRADYLADRRQQRIYMLLSLLPGLKQKGMSRDEMKIELENLTDIPGTKTLSPQEIEQLLQQIYPDKIANKKAWDNGNYSQDYFPGSNTAGPVSHEIPKAPGSNPRNDQHDYFSPSLIDREPEEAGQSTQPSEKGNEDLRAPNDDPWGESNLLRPFRNLRPNDNPEFNTGFDTEYTQRQFGSLHEFKRQVLAYLFPSKYGFFDGRIERNLIKEVYELEYKRSKTQNPQYSQFYSTELNKILSDIIPRMLDMMNEWFTMHSAQMDAFTSEDQEIITNVGKLITPLQNTDIVQFPLNEKVVLFHKLLTTSHISGAMADHIIITSQQDYINWQKQFDENVTEEDMPMIYSPGQMFLNELSSDKYIDQWNKDLRREDIIAKNKLNLKKQSNTFEKASLQTSNIPKELLDVIRDIQKSIPEDKLYTGEDDEWVKNGLQKKIHLTILFGVKDNDANVAKEIFGKYTNTAIETKKLRYFDNDDCTVAVVECKSKELQKLHKELVDNIEIEETHDNYIPHITIAYLKKGERIDAEIPDIKWDINNFEISLTSGKIKKLALSWWQDEDFKKNATETKEFDGKKYKKCTGMGLSGSIGAAFEVIRREGDTWVPAKRFDELQQLMEEIKKDLKKEAQIQPDEPKWITYLKNPQLPPEAVHQLISRAIQINDLNLPVAGLIVAKRQDTLPQTLEAIWKYGSMFNVTKTLIFNHPNFPPEMKKSLLTPSLDELGLEQKNEPQKEQPAQNFPPYVEEGKERLPIQGESFDLPKNSPLATRRRHLKFNSILDTPRAELDSAIWQVPQNRDELPMLVPKVRLQIVKNFFDYISKFGGYKDPQTWIKNMFYTGSTATYTYHDKSDIDIHIIVDWTDMLKANPEKVRDTAEEIWQELHDTFWWTLNQKKLPGTKHPLTYYVVKPGDEKSVIQQKEEIYDIGHSVWLIPPLKQPIAIPEQALSVAIKEAAFIISRIEEYLANARTQAIDYEMMKLLEQMAPDTTPELLIALDEKRQKLDEELMKLKDEYSLLKQKRRDAFQDGQPIAPSESKNYTTGNIIFKLVERYKLMDILRQIKRITDAQPLKHDQVDEIFKALELKNDEEV